MRNPFTKTVILFASAMYCASCASHLSYDLVAAPTVTKSLEASRRHLAGQGLFAVDVDTPSGRVNYVRVVESTGQPLLDLSAIRALQRWRWKPDMAATVLVPVRFIATDDRAQRM
jgi:TonB family protein